jgi:hypothetical protein
VLPAVALLLSLPMREPTVHAGPIGDDAAGVAAAPADSTDAGADRAGEPG